MPDVVTLGESMARLTATGIGPLRHASALRLGVAGAESNVAIGLARLGSTVAWIGRVGDDEFGRLIASTLRGEGVETHAIIDPSSPTGLLVKERWDATRTNVQYYRSHSAGSRLRSEDLDPELFARARHLHVTGITLAVSPSARAAVLRAMELARESGASVSLDVNYRAGLWTRDEATDVLGPLAREVDILIAGSDEARLLARPTEDRALLVALGALGPPEVVLKRGALGAWALVEGDLHETPPVVVVEADPVGAGDAFTAGYLAERLAGGSPQERLRVAAICGARLAATEGDWEGAPSRAELSIERPDSVHR